MEVHTMCVIPIKLPFHKKKHNLQSVQRCKLLLSSAPWSQDAQLPWRKSRVFAGSSAFRVRGDRHFVEHVRVCSTTNIYEYQYHHVMYKGRVWE